MLRGDQPVPNAPCVRTSLQKCADWSRPEAVFDRYGLIADMQELTKPRLSIRQKRYQALDKRITEYPKRHLADASLSIAVAGVELGELERDPALAERYFESFVTAQLRAEADSVSAHIGHVRSRAGEHEVDIVIDIAGRLIAIEVKAGSTRDDPTQNTSDGSLIRCRAMLRLLA